MNKERQEVHSEGNTWCDKSFKMKIQWKLSINNHPQIKDD
jgi:hypothetical protein